MKIRIKFSKQGSLKFVGHLDIMRYFQRALRRAGVKMRYSEGFNPHPVMSFAAPLGVGLTSDGEYVDIEVLESGTSAEMTESINAVLTDEMRVISYRLLPDATPKAMAQVAAADYTLKFYPEKAPEDEKVFIDSAGDFLRQKDISVQKESKSGRRIIDIRPMIYCFEIDGDMNIKMKVAAGSGANLRPETLMNAYMEYLGSFLRPVSLLINRDELYAAGSAENVFIPLEAFGEDI